MIDDSDLIIWAVLWTLIVPPFLLILAEHVSMMCCDGTINFNFYISLILIFGGLQVLIPSMSASIGKWVLGAADTLVLIWKRSSAIKSSSPVIQNESLEDSFSFSQSNEECEETFEEPDLEEMAPPPDVSTVVVHGKS